MSLATAIVAIAGEAAAGYPAALFRGIGHPVTWMGALLSHLDDRLNREAQPFERRRAMGAVALGILLLAVGTTGAAIQALVTFGLCDGAGGDRPGLSRLVVPRVPQSRRSCRRGRSGVAAWCRRRPDRRRPDRRA